MRALLLAPTTLRAQDAAPPEGWPACEAHEVQVMLFGTYHMANPGLDAHNIEADDVRSSARQPQLQAVADRLAAFRPDRIGVEWSYRRAAFADSLYDAAPIDTLVAQHRDEVVQLGMRLGRMLGHARVHPIDHPMMLGNDSLAALNARHPDGIPHKLAFPALDWDWEVMTRADQERLRAGMLLDYLRYINTEPRLSRNGIGMFAAIRRGEGENFGGAMMLAQWYDRNFRMVHNLYRAVEPGDERVLLIVGSGHVAPLRHLFDEAPMFCPVSPLPYLQ